jgi:hypothetical protein
MEQDGGRKYRLKRFRHPRRETQQVAKEAWSIAMLEVVRATENIRDWQPVVCAPVKSIIPQWNIEFKRYGGPL